MTEEVEAVVRESDGGRWKPKKNALEFKIVEKKGGKMEIKAKIYTVMQVVAWHASGLTSHE